MVLGKRLLFSIWNGAKIQPLEMGRKSPACIVLSWQAHKGRICHDKTNIRTINFFINLQSLIYLRHVQM